MNTERLCMGCMREKANEGVCPRCGWEEAAAPDSPVQLPLKTILNNKYLIGRVLGHGGFGITYLALDLELERKVAVKEYFPNDIAARSTKGEIVPVHSTDEIERFNYGLDKFLEEGKALAKFQDHPGIVSIVTFFKANGTGYLVMEYVEGITFKEYLEQEGGQVPFETALKILMPVMDALREVHSAGLLHRDISPENIYISENGQVKLLDFGAARYAVGDQSKSLSVILKHGYAPEEQYRSRGKQGPWTDVYALAATFYRAITGEVPLQALDRLVDDDLQPPSAFGVYIPGDSEKILLKALAVKSKDRTGSIREFQDMLISQKSPGINLKDTQLDAGNEEDEVSLSPTTPGQRQRQSNLAVVLGVVIAVLIGIILLLISNQGDNGNLQPGPGSSRGVESEARTGRVESQEREHSTPPIQRPSEMGFEGIGPVEAGKAGQYNKQGSIYLGRGEHQKAVREYKRAVKANKRNPEYWNNLGYAYQLIGKYETSNYFCQKALELSPRRAVAYGNMAYNFAKLDRGDRAVDYWMKYVNYLKKPRARKRGINYLKKMLRENEDRRIKVAIRKALTNLGIDY